MTPEQERAVRDAIFMLEDIKKAQQLPPYGQVHKQYIALAAELRKVFEKELAK
jgi:hypothetical protein